MGFNTKSGEYSMATDEALVAKDNKKNTASLNAEQVQALSAKPLTITIEGTLVDTKPPTLDSFFVTPDSFDLTDEAATITLRAKATDDVSGLNHYMVAYFVNEDTGAD